MKTQNNDSAQDQAATCDNNVLANRLFRGFSKKQNNWIYGDLIHTPEKRMRIINYTDVSSDGVDNFVTINEMVEAKSVSQFTGLKDIEGKKIYEGDIILGYNNPHVVTFADGAFYLTYKNSSVRLSITCGALKIIGNIFENPELTQTTS